MAVVTLPLPTDLRHSGAQATKHLRVTPLRRQRDVAICATAHPLHRRRRVTLADLAAYPLLLLDATTGSRAVIERELGTRVHVAMEMSSVEVLKRLARPPRRACLGLAREWATGLATW